MFLTVRGIRSKTTEENDEEAGPGVKMLGCISQMYRWMVVITDTARAWFFYSVYTKEFHDSLRK